MLRRQLQDAYSDLHLRQRGDLMVAEGSFPLVDGGRVIDRYRIEIELPRTYPRGLLVLREVGGRIPTDADRHVEEDGRACVFLPDEFCYRYPGGMGLLEFLAGPVQGFLVGQSLVDRGHPWPQGERGHGAAGVLEFYGPLVGVADVAVIERYVEALARKELPGHLACPCGSGKRVRNCHRGFLMDLRERIPVRVAESSLRVLQRARARS